VATTIVCGVFGLIALWFTASVTVGGPKVFECVKDNRKPAVAMVIEPTRLYGYFRTYEVGKCTAYFITNNKAKHFR
jgi:hypothetical protein